MAGKDSLKPLVVTTPPVNIADMTDSEIEEYAAGLFEEVRIQYGDKL